MHLLASQNEFARTRLIFESTADGLSDVIDVNGRVLEIEFVTSCEDAVGSFAYQSALSQKVNQVAFGSEGEIGFEQGHGRVGLQGS